MLTFKEFLAENEFLTEDYDYGQMFGKYLELFPDNEKVENTIVWAKHNLKKNVRIIWYLQWYALRAIFRIFNVSYDVERLKLYTKKLQDMAKKCNKSVEEIKSIVEGIDSIEFSRNLKHYYDLNLQEINDINPATYTPPELFAKFDEIEKSWSNNIQGTIPYLSQPLWNDDLLDNENEKNNACILVMDLGNDWYWVDLNKHSCDLESDSMGHCGTAEYGSTLISLRKLNKRRSDPDSWLWEPHVTFELDEKHNLRQMKGKSNDKPSEKYHPAIIKLLKYKSVISSNGDTGYYINAVIGGGYRPETNFKLADLSESDYNDLVEVRPELMPLEDLYKKEGLSENVINMVTTISGCKYLPNEKCFIILTVKKGVYDFVEDYGNDTAKWVGKVMSGDEFIDMDSGNDGDDILDELDKDKITEYLEKYYPLDKEDWEDDVKDYVRHNIDDIWDECVQAVNRGQEDGTQDEMYKALTKGLMNISIIVDGDETDYTCYINKMFETDDSCLVKISPTEIIGFITDYRTDVDEDNYEFLVKVSEPHYGYDEYSKEAALEYAKHETEVIKDLF